MRGGEKKWPWGFLLFCAFGCVLLVTLGLWQLERKAWKTALLARMHEDKPLAEAVFFSEQMPEDSAYRRAVLRLRPLPDVRPVRVLATKDGQIGADIFFPVTLCAVPAGGVKRSFYLSPGFIAQDKDTGTLPGLEAGCNALSVRVRPAQRYPGWIRRWMPSQAKSGLHLRDPARFPGASALMERDIYLQRLSVSVAGSIIEARPGLVFPHNRHLGYALTWFSLAFSLALVGLAYSWRRMRA